MASYGRVITLLTKNFAHGAGFEPTMGLLRQINSLDRSANYGNPYFCGEGGIRTHCVSYVLDLQSSALPPSEQPPRSPLIHYFIITLGKVITFYGKGVALVLGAAML